MTNVVSLANKTQDGTYTDVVTTLQQIIDDPQTSRYDRCVVILVDTAGGKFDVGFFNAKMRTSEILAACEVMKARCLAMMGWINGRDT